jgi:hypothetical protein
MYNKIIKADKTQSVSPLFIPLYLHPPQVLQFPEHFLLVVPVAEYIAPE